MKQGALNSNKAVSIEKEESLLSLADKVLRRNEEHNKSVGCVSQLVSPGEQAHGNSVSPLAEIKSDLATISPMVTNTAESYGYLADLFEERISMYQHEAGYTQEEAELWARKDMLAELVERHYPPVNKELNDVIKWRLESKH